MLCHIDSTWLLASLANAFMRWQNDRIIIVSSVHGFFFSILSEYLNLNLSYLVSCITANAFGAKRQPQPEWTVSSLQHGTEMLPRHSGGHISQTLDGSKIKEMILERGGKATSITATSDCLSVLLLGRRRQSYLFRSLGHCKQAAADSEGG